MPRARFKIVVCRGPECGDQRGSKSIYDALHEAVSVRGAQEHACLEWHSCFGRCSLGPNVLVRELPDQAEQRFLFAPTRGARRRRAALYNGVTPEDALELVDEHVVRGRLVRRLIRRAASDAGGEAAPAAAPRQPIMARAIKKDGTHGDS